MVQRMELLSNWLAGIWGGKSISYVWKGMAFLRKDSLFEWCRLKGKVCRWTLQTGIVRFLQAFSFCGKTKIYLQGGVLPHKIVSLYLRGSTPKKICSSYLTTGYWAVILVWKGARVRLAWLISGRLLPQLTRRILYYRKTKMGHYELNMSDIIACRIQLGRVVVIGYEGVQY